MTGSTTTGAKSEPGRCAEDETKHSDSSLPGVPTVPGQWRLLAPALCSWAFAAVAVAHPGSATIIGVIAGLTGVGLMAAWVHLRKSLASVLARASRIALSLGLICCALLVLICGRIFVLEQVRTAQELLHAANSGQQLQVSARLASYPQQLDGIFGERAWVRAEVDASRGSVPVLLWYESESLPTLEWGPGTQVQFSGRFTQQPASDSAVYSVQVSELRELPAATASATIATFTAKLRSSLVAHATRVPGAELVPGFAVGDTQLVDEQLHENMLQSSLSHLVAVSGSNTSLVVAAVMWASSWLAAGVRVRLVIASLGLAMFVVIVGPDASVQRAAVMASVMLLSGFGGKRGVGLAALGMAIVVLLCVNPWQALQPGFALSVAATGGILVGTQPLAIWMQRRLRLPSPLALAVAVAAIAQFACAPLLLLLQEGISGIGVIANVLAAPAAPLGTGFGLLATVLIPFSPELSVAAVWVASLAARWVAGVASVTAGVPFGRWDWPQGWGGAVALAACQAVLLLAWAIATGRVGIARVGRVRPQQPWQVRAYSPLALRVTVAIMLGAACGVIFGVTAITPHATRLAVPRDWIVVACDVGQGDALLIRDLRRPDEVMLVDTGDDEALLQDCLTDFGVDRIALLVLSHDDRDHVGALDSVVDQVDAALISPPTRSAGSSSRPVEEALKQAGVPHRVSVAGDGRSAPGQLQWKTLAPTALAQPVSTNAASLVMLVQTGDVRVLLLGDTGENEQAALLRTGENIEADVMKVAHHGSRDQSEQFIAAVGAKWAIISVGSENGYGHPNQQTLARLVESRMQVLRTDTQGHIALREQVDAPVSVWVERVPPQERLG